MKNLGSCTPEEIKKRIEAVIAMKDQFSAYNYVGGPVRVVEWNME